jgi:hypothetical protein
LVIRPAIRERECAQSDGSKTMYGGFSKVPMRDRTGERSHEGWNRLTDKALGFALSLSPHVTTVHLKKLNPDEEKEARLRR